MAQEKHGLGSGLPGAQARFVVAEWKRLEGFAGDKTGAKGEVERAPGRRRNVDRALMNGE